MQKQKKSKLVSSSFRDPSGFLFVLGGELHRQVNLSYRENYDYLISSGFAKQLIEKELLISHKEVALRYAYSAEAHKIIKPEFIPFISYPYEWCFSQLKDAALLTLQLQRRAMEAGMSLKDASVFNVQFLRGKPIFIDTLSFEKYKEGEPWVAYSQFCEHFLAPLALMAYRDTRLNVLLRDFLDGVPIDLASCLLPFRTWLKSSFLFHIHLHAMFQKRYSAPEKKKSFGRKMDKRELLRLVESLGGAIASLRWKPGGTEWAEYYGETNYGVAAFADKKHIIGGFLDSIQPKSVWDLGANAGEFSRLAGDRGIPTISFDADPAAVEKNYLEIKARKEKHIVPLVIDMVNPSPDIGWENEERVSLMKRGPADAVMALALIHHLAISNNLPLSRIASFFSKISGHYLIVEFVPKEDSNAQRLLVFRKDIFPKYALKYFEMAFSRFFTIKKARQIKESKRTLYLMKNKRRIN